MNPKQYDALKRFPLLRFLAAVNRVPVYAAGRERYYISPLRDERTASFSVHVLKNCWYDHGLGVGGNILDLAMRLFATDFKTAGQMLAQLAASPEQLPIADVTEAERLNRGFVVEVHSEKKKLLHTCRLRHPRLLEYLVSRGISLNAIHADEVWAKVCEVHYTQPRKNGSLGRYYAIGMLNEAGGVELTARDFKSQLGPKDVTFIPGPQPGVVIFEGMMDYFSALTRRYKRNKGVVSKYQCSVLILHSARLAKKALHLVKNRGPIFYYGDNDQTGIDLMHWYKQQCKGQPFYAMNEQYRGYKDFNDWLTKTPPSKPLPARGQAPSYHAETRKWWLWVVFAAGPGGRKERQCTFYSYDNTPAGYARLLLLRSRLSEDAKVICLCTRTGGRDYTWEQLYCPSGQVTAGTRADRQRGPGAKPRLRVQHENPGSWGRPGYTRTLASAK